MSSPLVVCYNWAMNWLTDSAKSAPKILIIAGPNGAGKTTFAKTLVDAWIMCDNATNEPNIIAWGENHGSA